MRQARRQSALPMRVVAARAGVPVSTVSRVESGRVDPTVGMLHRLVAATGQRLILGTTPDDAAPPPETVGEVSARWRRSAARGPADWACLRSLATYLADHPERVDAAVRRPPPPSGSAMLDDVLAGVAGELAAQAGLPRPTWTRSRSRTGAGRGGV